MNQQGPPAQETGAAAPAPPAGSSSAQQFWPALHPYGYNGPQLTFPQHNPWLIHTPPPAPQKRNYLPRKAKKRDMETGSSASAMCINGISLPQRCGNDINIPTKLQDRCFECNYWVGRYILKPCFHFGICIFCLEKLFKGNSIPACSYCKTPLEGFVLGYKCCIGE